MGLPHPTLSAGVLGCLELGPRSRHWVSFPAKLEWSLQGAPRNRLEEEILSCTCLLVYSLCRIRDMTVVVHAGVGLGYTHCMHSGFRPGLGVSSTLVNWTGSNS